MRDDGQLLSHARENRQVGRETAPHKLILQSYESLHFILRGRDYQTISKIANLCETIYSKIMFDTNLFSFKPKQNYLIVIYGDQKDYAMETGYPPWSGGGTITIPVGKILPSEKEQKARTAIFTFEENATPPTIAHEIAHLIFNEFMAYQTDEEMQASRWLNEGLATFEELEAYEKSEQENSLSLTEPLLKRNMSSLETVVRFNPFAEKVNLLGTYHYKGQSYFYSNIDVWYWQVRSVTKYLIEREGQYSFFQLLNALKRNKELSSALAEAYPGKWRSLTELESEWRESF